MALALGGVSLLTAALGAATLALPAAQAWAEGKSLWFGSAIVAVVLVSCALARQLARQRPAPAALLARPGTAPRANFP